MSDNGAIDAASKRLSLALDALEAAVERRREAARAEQRLTVQVHMLDTDRARLAAELDNAVARSRAIETANREIAQRLDGAMQTIRAVLAANER